MTTETITLNEFIYDNVSYHLQSYVNYRYFIIYKDDGDHGEMDDYYNDNGQYEYDLNFLIELMKDRIEEDSLYDFGIDNNFKIDYDCQGRIDRMNFVGSPYPEFDTKLYEFLEDRLTEEIDDTFFEDEPPVYLK